MEPTIENKIDAQFERSHYNALLGDDRPIIVVDLDFDHDPRDLTDAQIEGVYTFDLDAAGHSYFAENGLTVETEEELEETSLGNNHLAGAARRIGERLVERIASLGLPLTDPVVILCPMVGYAVVPSALADAWVEGYRAAGWPAGRNADALRLFEETDATVEAMQARKQ